jgi:dolichol-phosphate mannosyltransferase
MSEGAAPDHGGPAPVDFTVALPVYGEAGILEELHARLTEACAATGSPYEVLYVDDGSRDGSAAVLARLAGADPHVTVVGLSRNFGHPAALAAAVDLARGRCLILMDADLQDDPAVVPELLRLHREGGAETVHVVRSERREAWPLRVAFAAFHWLIARTSSYHIPARVGSFGLLGPRALAEVRRLPERLRYLPGLRAFVGFRQAALQVPRAARYDRRSRVGLGGLLRLAALALFTQSRAPVTLFYGLSLASVLIGVGLAGYAFLSKLAGIAVVSWASTVTSIAFFSSVIILGQAFICEYLSRIYEEVRQRPPYILDFVRPARILAGGGDGTTHRS